LLVLFITNFQLTGNPGFTKVFVFTPECFFVFVDCKTVVFFANAGDRQYANARRSGASVKTASENGERRALQACEARALHKRGSHLRPFAPSQKVRKRLFCSLSFSRNSDQQKAKLKNSGGATQVSSGERFVKAQVFLNLTLLAIVR